MSSATHIKQTGGNMPDIKDFIKAYVSHESFTNFLKALLILPALWFAMVSILCI